MNDFIPFKRVIGLFSVVVLTTILVVAAVFALSLLDNYIDNSTLSAQVIDVDEPPTNATEELDVKVDATEPLPANGTITVDISEADDIDIDAIPPEGISIVVTNTTLTVTNSPVEIPEGATGTQPGTENPDTSGDSATSGPGNEVEESSDEDEE